MTTQTISKTHSTKIRHQLIWNSLHHVTECLEPKMNAVSPHSELLTRAWHTMLARLTDKCDWLMFDITMHIYLCQDWSIISLLNSRTMLFAIVLVKLTKWSLSVSSQGTGMQQELHRFVSSMVHMESTQTCRNWTTSITATIGIESFQWQCSWSCFSMHASCINPRRIQICSSQHWMDLIMARTWPMRCLWPHWLSCSTRSNYADSE